MSLSFEAWCLLPIFVILFFFFKVCHEDIIGPRFSCIHCTPSGLNTCLACSDDAAMLEISAPAHNPASHAYQIFFEDQAFETTAANGTGGNLPMLSETDGGGAAGAEKPAAGPGFERWMQTVKHAEALLNDARARANQRPRAQNREGENGCQPS